MHDVSPILLFGGTFDPPTRAHATLPPRAAALVGAERLLYVPAAISPHKLDQAPTAAMHRLAMLERALADTDGVEIRTLELDREGPSYTVDTVEAMRSEFGPDTPLRLLIGDDQAESFHRWKDWERILELAEPLVLPRRHDTPEAFAAAMAGSDAGWSEADVRTWVDRRLDLPCMTMCSTDARNQLEAGDDADEALDANVLAYIQEQSLYR